MPKFLVDLDQVARNMSKRAFKFADVQDKFERVAFDIFRKKDGNAEELWQVQNADDGDYIVALYNDEEEKIATASVPAWSVIVKNADFHIFYKQDYLCKVAASQLGFENTDIELAQRYLPSKLASNKNLVKALFNTVNNETRKEWLAKYPELC